MKKILLLLTFIIACNFAPQCHTQPFFTGKDNPAPVIIIAAALAAAGIGVYGIYLFIYDKFFSVNNGNINIKFGNNWKFIKGNRTQETKTIILNNNFEGIIASDSGNLNIHKSNDDTNTLETTADQNILKYLTSTFNNNTYTIEMKPPTCTSIKPTTPVEYNLYLNSTTLANLKSFKADNYLKAMLSNHITNNQFKLCAENHAEIDATFKSLNQLSIDGQNYAKITATGTTIKTLSINSQNHATITATGTEINNLSIDSKNYDNIIVNGQIERTKATLSNYADATVNTKNLSYNITNYASLTHNRDANITDNKDSNYAKTITY